MASGKKQDGSINSMEKDKKHPTENAQPAALPIFYQRPMPIDSNRHKKAGILPMQNYSFATGTNSIALNLVEFGEAAKCYPIVFTSDKPCTPAAIVGLEKSNYFVGEDGKWKEEHYIPAYIRKYPFILMNIQEKNQFILCVDEGSDRFCADNVEGMIPFYDKEEKPSEIIRSIFDFSMAFQEQTVITQQFTAALEETGLLSPHTSNLTLTNGRNIRLGGFQMIDEKKFNALPDEKILEFHKKGWLPYIYLALISASNWKKIGDMASLREAKIKAA